jgi:hypothetical protein
MAENKHPHPPYPAEPEIEPREPRLEKPRLEERDVNVWAVGKFGIALVFLCIFALVLLAGLVKYFVSTERPPGPASADVNVDARRLPPEPRLQSAPILDLQEMRAAEDEVLNGYGWIDQEKQIVRIPIGRAMDLLAARGLPARPPEQAPASEVTVPTESGLGPKVHQPGGPLAPELTTPRQGR